MMRFLSLCLAFCLTVTSAQADMFGPIAGRVFGSGQNTLVVIAHGDSGPNYIGGFAQQLSQRNPNATVIQLARPGYPLGAAGRSKGSNRGGRDHYTRRNNNLLAQGVAAAAAAHPHNELIAVGHSGGANQFGVIIARNPGLIDTAILVSGGFDIPAWRVSRGKGPWPNSESPIRFVKKLPKSTKIIAATGASDNNTRPRLAEAYVKKAKAAGANATFIQISGAGHGFSSLHPHVLKIVEQEIRN